MKKSEKKVLKFGTPFPKSLGKTKIKTVKKLKAEKTIPKKFSILKRGLTEKEIQTLGEKYDKKTLKSLINTRYKTTEKKYDRMTKKDLLTTLQKPQTKAKIYSPSKKSTATRKVVRFDSKPKTIKSFTPSIEKVMQEFKPLSPLGEVSDETYYSGRSAGEICQNPNKTGKYKDYLYIRIPDSPECSLFTESRIQDFYLRNLKKSLVITKPTKIMAPMQYQSNCWFNCMFMTFFISDKGRKFFKYFRRLMIQGKRIHQKGITNKELQYNLPIKLHGALFMLNMLIHKSLAGLLNASDDTNIIIKRVFNSIPEYKRRVKSEQTSGTLKLADTGENSNALTFYKVLFNYLNDKFLKLQEFTDFGGSNTNILRSDYEFISEIKQKVSENLNDEFSNYSKIYKKTITRRTKTLGNQELKFPDIIVVEIFDGESQSKQSTPNEFTLKTDVGSNMSANYKLDSAIIRDVTKSHFACVLTINGTEYGFDGESLKKLNRFKWKNLLTENRNWTFKGSGTKWNFRNGYQQLFYYRTK